MNKFIIITITSVIAVICAIFALKFRKKQYHYDIDEILGIG